MNFAKHFSWNPLLRPLAEFNLFCSIDGATPAPGGGGEASPPGGGTPAPTGGDSPGSGSDSAPGAGDVSSGADAFSGFENDDLDSIDLGDVVADDGTTPPETPPVVPPVQQQQPPQGTTPPTPPVVAQPQVPPQTAAAPEAPRSAREELSSAVDGFKNNFNELVGWAQNELFKLSPEETDALDTNAVEAIPKLMARTYTQAVMASANIMRNFTQRMIEEGFVAQQEKTARSTEAKNEFYKQFPGLDAAKHDDLVAQYAKTYRQMNPKATRADAIKFVGAAVHAHLGLPLQAPSTQGTTVRTPPFTPAIPGGRAPATSGPEDPYAGMDTDFLDVG